MAKSSELIKVLQSWVGKKEKDGSHKSIIDLYNSNKPLPRGYKVKYNDAWCATTMGAAAIQCKATDIIPIECSCGKMIEIAKRMGIWVENENRAPAVGEIILYDWQDGTNFAAVDNKGYPEHVGMVEKVFGNKITVIEGNIKDAVGRRTLDVNGRYIRGYIVPKYDPEITQEVATTTSKFNPEVKEWQDAAIADGFEFPKYGADGEWGAECEAVAKIAVVKERKSNGKWVWKYPNLTKFAQKKLGFADDDIDGKCGNDTGDGIEDFQAEKGLEEDRCCGLNTWKEMLGV